MNFIQSESAEKLRGGFYTDASIAAFLTKWVSSSRPARILEPSCGDGVFLQALSECASASFTEVVACEVNPEEAGKAKARAPSLPLRLHVGDFLSRFLDNCSEDGAFDGVLGNPPFVRYQYLSDAQQARAAEIFARFDLPFTKHTNLWVPFVIASLALLRPGGRLAMVVPSEILHIPHAQSLRRFLRDRCARTLIIDPEELWFSNTLQGTVLLLAERSSTVDAATNGIGIVSVRGRKPLLENPEVIFQNAHYAKSDLESGKWMSFLLTRDERTLINELRTNKQIRPFASLASVDVGIVTGANKFFLVPDEIVQEYELKRWAHPMFGRSEHVQGLIYTEADHEANRSAGLPVNFLWFRHETFDQLPRGAQRYLRKGLTENLHTRYKCRIRTPWFQVPSVYSAPVAMLKRAHHLPRLVHNQAGTYTTDTAYRIKPHGMPAEALVLNFLNSLTCLTAELEGRHYGGGVLELVPSEIERLLIPVTPCPVAELERADAAWRNGPDAAAFLGSHSRTILARVGLNQSDQDVLLNAWERLRKRRQREFRSDQAPGSETQGA